MNNQKLIRKLIPWIITIDYRTSLLILSVLFLGKLLGNVHHPFNSAYYAQLDIQYFHVYRKELVRES